jgi:hypothetical protein
MQLKWDLSVYCSLRIVKLLSVHFREFWGAVKLKCFDLFVIIFGEESSTWVTFLDCFFKLVL